MTNNNQIVVMNAIREEQRNNQKRELPVHDPVRCAGLLCEEAGEVMKAALDMTRSRINEDAKFQIEREMVHEIIQVASLALTWLEERYYGIQLPTDVRKEGP